MERAHSRRMKILISGICGFVGSTLARALLDTDSSISITGFDNFIRPGSQSNIAELKQRGVAIVHADIRSTSDFETLPTTDWAIDCAASPSVLAGVDGHTSSRQLVEHNLGGTINLLEYCKQHRAGFVLLSTSRVYSITGLSTLPVTVRKGAYFPDDSASLPKGISAAGVSEDYSTDTPVSLYGATKLASETISLEYGETYDFPVFINRCGVMAGAGQFGRPDQGIFAYWIHSWARKRPLKYIGFGGQGHQVRDCLHPADLVPLIQAQIAATNPPETRTVNVSGGAVSARSLKQLSEWCRDRFGDHEVASEKMPRPFDIPWMVLDSTQAGNVWGWRPTRSTNEILEEIATHADEAHDWLDLSAPL